MKCSNLPFKIIHTVLKLSEVGLKLSHAPAQRRTRSRSQTKTQLREPYRISPWLNLPALGTIISSYFCLCMPVSAQRNQCETLAVTFLV